MEGVGSSDLCAINEMIDLMNRANTTDIAQRHEYMARVSVLFKHVQNTPLRPEEYCPASSVAQERFAAIVKVTNDMTLVESAWEGGLLNDIMMWCQHHFNWSGS